MDVLSIHSRCVIAGLDPSNPLIRHFIAIPCVKMPTHWVACLLCSCDCHQLLPSLEEESFAVSLSPVVTNCSLLLPDFLLTNCFGLLNNSHCDTVTSSPSSTGWTCIREFWLPEPLICFWNCPEFLCIGFSTLLSTLLFINSIMRYSTWRWDSPPGAWKSGWDLSIALSKSGV